MRNILGFCAIFGALSGALGCGGNVTVDNGTANGGAGGQGSGGQGGGGATLQTECAQLCDAAAKKGCGEEPSCAPTCVTGFENIFGKCPAQVQAYFQCVEAAIAAQGCNPDMGCVKEANDLNTCGMQDKNGCTPEGCSGDGTTCGCKGNCGGAEVSVDCGHKSGQPDGVVTCTCHLTDGQVTTCQQSTLECGLALSCCGDQFGK